MNSSKMVKQLLFIKGIALLAASIIYCQPVYAQSADMIFHNGEIHTMDDQRKVVSAIAISGNKIVRVGTDQDVLSLKNGDTTLVDLKKRMVLPGLIDGHVHIGVAQGYTDACSLRSAVIKSDLIDLMKACAESHEGDDWLWGFGYNPQALGAINFTLEELDKVFPDTPIAMVSIQHGRSFFNSAALDKMEYGKQKGDLDRKDLTRDTSGKPAGAALGDTGFLRLGLLGPSNTQALLKELKKFSAYGITSFYDAGIFVEDWEERMRKFVELDKKGQLSSRANLSFVLGLNGGEYSEKLLADYVKLKNEIASPRVKLESIKVFGDAEPHMVKPYENGENTPPLMSTEVLASAVPAATAEGFGFHIHVMGDGTTRAALDVFEQSKAARKPSAPRHTLSHLGFVHPDDLQRFKALDVVANISAVWAYPNSLSYFTGEGLLPSLIGSERMKRVMAFDSLEDEGAVLSSSSDYPFSELNPFQGIEVGVTRRNPSRDSKVFKGDQVVSLDTMLESYTRNAAYQLGQEKVLGSLESGKFADLIVLNQNLYEIKPEKISDTQVELTVVGGSVVFQSAVGNDLISGK